MSSHCLSPRPTAACVIPPPLISSYCAYVIPPPPMSFYRCLCYPTACQLLLHRSVNLIIPVVWLRMTTFNWITLLKVKNSYVDNQAFLSYWHHAIPPSRYTTNSYYSKHFPNLPSAGCLSLPAASHDAVFLPLSVSQHNLQPLPIATFDSPPRLPPSLFLQDVRPTRNCGGDELPSPPEAPLG